MAVIVEVVDLRKRFGSVVALDGVSCRFAEGATGLLGPNGAGKTTLLRILLGLLPAEGRASVLGVDPMRRPLDVRARIGYMPESECLIPGLRGVEVVAFLGRLAGMPVRAALKRAHEVLYFVGLGEARYRDVSEFSQGMQQRLKLAQALVHDPDLLFLDEPTNGLDPRGRIEMLDLVRELARVHGKHVILSSHLLPDVEEVCTEVVMLRGGKVAQRGDLAGMTASEGGTYEIDLRGDRDAFAAALRGRDVEIAEGPRILARLPRGAETGVFFQAARDSGAQIRGLRPIRRTLEDVFLEAVGE